MPRAVVVNLQSKEETRGCLSPLPYVLVVPHSSDISSPLRALVHPESLFLILSSQTYETGLLFNQSYAFSSARSSFRISSTSIPKGHSTGVPIRGPANENAALKEKGPACVLTCCQTRTQYQKSWKFIKITSRPLLLDGLTDPTRDFNTAIDKWNPENFIMTV